MSKKTGSQTRQILRLGAVATVYGTALAASTGDRIRGTITPSYNNQELIKNAIGSGLVMQDEIQKGRITPVVTLATDAGFQNGTDKLAAQFFSTASAPAEQTASQSDYLHRLTLNPTENAFFLTYAYELTSAAVAEHPSCAVRSLTTSFTEADQYMQVSAELLCNDLILNTAVNTNTVIGASTFGDQECVRVKTSDDFYLNLQSGADFASGDRFKILSYTRTLTRPQEFMGNVRGATGNDKPLSTGMPTGTLSVTLEALENINMFTAWNTEAYYKCKLEIEGSQIGTGLNKSWVEFCPRMKLVQTPTYPISNPGFNQVTFNFTLFEAAANPTGMNSTRPYLELINGRSTSYIA
jgi:hypothetical protein